MKKSFFCDFPAMEGNRDEARRCIERAYIYLKSKNLENARKFALKAQKLYPSVQGQNLLNEIDSLTEDSSANGEVPHEEPQYQEEQEVKYTQEQVNLVTRIKKAKNFYEMLGVTKDSTDSEIRKSYKKLALHLHPDKNHAPGSVEAFKALGNAVAVLTDPEKKKNYDLFGDRSFSSSRNASHRHNQDMYREFQSDEAAEELFNMFFRDGFSSNSGHRRYTHRHHDNVNSKSY